MLYPALSYVNINLFQVNMFQARPVKFCLCGVPWAG